MNKAGTQRDLLRAALACGRVMRWSEMRRDGLSRRALTGLVDSGEIDRLGHDVYRLAAAPVPKFSQWEEIAAKYPKHCICLLSAARHHGLTTQMPSQTWVALPTGSKPSDSTVRCVQWPLLGTDGKAHKAWSLGVEDVGEGSQVFRVTGAARTVVDLCRWRDRLEDGKRVFLEAVQEYARQGMDRPELRKVAREFSTYGPIQEALAAWSEFTNNF